MDYETHSDNSQGNHLGAKEYVLVNVSKMLSEFSGTAFLSVYFYTNKGKFSGIFFAYWITSLFAFTISGAHFNPIITLCQMLRRNSNFGSRRLKGILYILAQMLGGLVGAFLCTLIYKGDADSLRKRPEYTGFDYSKKEDQGWLATWICELIGSFLFCLFYMISTAKETRYSKDNVLNCLVISASYLSAR